MKLYNSKRMKKTNRKGITRWWCRECRGKQMCAHSSMTEYEYSPHYKAKIEQDNISCMLTFNNKQKQQLRFD